MTYDEFISRVQDRTRLGTLGEIIGTIHATLETLAERLTDDEAKDIASQLPREVAVYLLGSVLVEPDRMSLDEFLYRIMRREEMNPPNAVEHARSVLEVVAEAIAEGEKPEALDPLPQPF